MLGVILSVTNTSDAASVVVRSLRVCRVPKWSKMFMIIADEVYYTPDARQLLAELAAQAPARVEVCPELASKSIAT